MEEKTKEADPKAHTSRPEPPTTSCVETTTPPEAAADPARAKALDEAWRQKNLFIPAAMSCLMGQDHVGMQGAKFCLEDFLNRAGKPTDPVERVLLEQMWLCHHRLTLLYLKIEATRSVEHLKVLHAAANRLLGEVRRLALAIRAYRQPVSNRSFAVIGQQNVVASGHQQVQYVDQSSPAESKVALKVQDRVEMEGKTAKEIHSDDDSHDSKRPGMPEESPARGRWATERQQAAALG